MSRARGASDDMFGCGFRKVPYDGGGYILAPCHNIQAISPPENIVAMYETGYALGWR
jgi:hypothetical protein